jgi:hypothetical protein
MTKTVRKTAALATVAALAFGAAACGEDEPDNEGGQVETGSEAPAELEISTTQQGKKPQFQVPTDAKSGVTKITFRNGAKKPGEAQIVRVEGDHSPQEFVRVVERQGGPIPSWIQDGGGVAATDPGQTGTAVQNLAPGNYIIASAPAGPGDGQATAELRVEGGGRQSELPEADAEIIARDYSFDVSGLKPGRLKVLFKNEGRELHHAVGFPIRPGSTIEDVRRYAQEQGRPSGEPPVDERAGFSTPVIDGGVEEVIDLNVKKPGRHAVMCFIQDRRGGPPHVMKGMIREVDIR